MEILHWSCDPQRNIIEFYWQEGGYLSIIPRVPSKMLTGVVPIPTFLWEYLRRFLLEYLHKVLLQKFLQYFHVGSLLWIIHSLDHRVPLEISTIFFFVNFTAAIILGVCLELGSFKRTSKISSRIFSFKSSFRIPFFLQNFVHNYSKEFHQTIH